MSAFAKKGKPKRRIIPQKEGECTTTAAAAAEKGGGGDDADQARSSGTNLLATSTAGRVKGGIRVDLSKGYDFDWEELKKEHNFHEEKHKPSRKKAEVEEKDAQKNLLSMLGKRGPTRLLHRIMKRHDRMFTVRDREYYTRSSSGETSVSGGSTEQEGSDEEGEAVEEGVAEDEEEEDERPDVGNYDLDDAFIDDSEVKEFFDGLLKRKPKYQGFCIVKGPVTVPVDAEDTAGKNLMRISRKRKATPKDAKKSSTSSTKKIYRTEPSATANAAASLAEQAIRAALGQTSQPIPSKDGPDQPKQVKVNQDTSLGQPMPVQNPLGRMKQSNAERARAAVKAIDHGPILQKAVHEGADKRRLWAHWQNLPNKPLCRLVFLALCTAGPAGLSSKGISEVATRLWPEIDLSDKKRGMITKFISAHSHGENPVFRKGKLQYALECFPLSEHANGPRKPSRSSAKSAPEVEVLLHNDGQPRDSEAPKLQDFLVAAIPGDSGSLVKSHPGQSQKNESFCRDPAASRSGAVSMASLPVISAPVPQHTLVAPVHVSGSCTQSAAVQGVAGLCHNPQKPATRDAVADCQSVSKIQESSILPSESGGNLKGVTKQSALMPSASAFTHHGAASLVLPRSREVEKKDI